MLYQIVKNLPKGYKWKDERTIKYAHKLRIRHTTETETYIFYPIDTDLYIKINRYKRTQIIKVIDYKKYTANNIIQALDNVPILLESNIRKYYKSIGLKQGYTYPLLKDIKIL